MNIVELNQEEVLLVQGGGIVGFFVNVASAIALVALVSWPRVIVSTTSGWEEMTVQGDDYGYHSSISFEDKFLAVVGHVFSKKNVKNMLVVLGCVYLGTIVFKTIGAIVERVFGVN